MAFVQGVYATAQTGVELVAAIENKVIRVRRIVVTSWSSLKVTLLSDGAGDDERELIGPIHFGAAHVGVLDLPERDGFKCDKGKNLAMTTTYQGLPGEANVMVWYDILPT